MYSLFFHLSGLALIEIIFYFNYIGPMETYVFKNAIEHAGSYNSVDDEENNAPIIHIINPFNSSQIFEFDTNVESNYSLHLRNSAQQATYERNRYNKELYDLSLVYWTYLMSFSIIVFCSEYSIRYMLFLQETRRNHYTNDEDDSASIEMTNLEDEPLRNRNRLDSLEESYETNDTNITDIIPIDTNDHDQDQASFINWSNVRKIVIEATAYNSALAALVLTFEYLFFTNIILRYKIISLDEITYVLFQILNSLIYHFVENEMRLIGQ